MLWWLKIATLLGWLLSSIFVLSLAPAVPELVTGGPAMAHIPFHRLDGNE
jgi:hypothetical protein